MNTNEDLRARLLAAWKDGRIVNMPKPGEPGKRVVGYVIEWDESFPMLPGAIIAALARQEEGREAVAWIDERDLAELQDGKQAKTVVFPDRLDERDLPLYLQPPATVSADAGAGAGGEVAKRRRTLG